MKYLFMENRNDKKINKVIDKYRQLLKENNNKSKNIVLLVANNAIKLKYQRSINLEFSEEINIVTYIGFIRKEIIKYWPLIVENCDKINNKLISPKFISSSLSEYIITEQVRKKRNLEGYFNDITGTSRNIANSINTNINKALLSLIDFETIGERIYLSKKNKDKIPRFSYSQMDEIIAYYIDTLLSNGMIDNSLSVYLYNNYLLKDEKYINKLKKEVKYIIVDSLESSSIAEIEFIDIISDYTLDSYLYMNNTRDYSVFNNIDMDYIRSKIINKEYEYIDEDSISSELYCTRLEDLYELNTNINLNQSSQLYSEMIEEICEKVIELVGNGTSKNKIAIISPINNTILDYQVKNILSKNNIDVVNTKKDKKIVDYPYANALVVASCIFYGCLELIKDEEYINFIEIILNVNKIQSLKIFNNKEESKEYNQILDYIESKKDSDIKINEFLIQFYIDKMLNLEDGKENVHICKQIINESEIFIENISLLNLDREKSKEQIFIEALKTTINDYYSTSDLEDLRESNKVIITTPYSYISSNMNRPIQIWVDIGSNAWNMKIEKELSNMIVLRQSFDEKSIYTDTMEENYKKYYLYNTIYNLLVNTKEVYAYKSEYTVNGYIQESILYSLLLRILDKGNMYE